MGQLAEEIVPPGSDSDSGTRYLTADHLGSTRMVTDATGAIVQRLDYLPFGETIPGSSGYGGSDLRRAETAAMQA
jgi:hypothetical protein